MVIVCDWIKDQIESVEFVEYNTAIGMNFMNEYDIEDFCRCLVALTSKGFFKIMPTNHNSITKYYKHMFRKIFQNKLLCLMIILQCVSVKIYPTCSTTKNIQGLTQWSLVPLGPNRI